MQSRRAEVFALTALLLALFSAAGTVYGIARAEANAAGDVPEVINYQGFLSLPDGSPAHGIYAITARIYDHVLTGTVLYTQEFQDVAVTNGVFSLLLGDERPAGQPLLSEVFAGTPRYIGITVAGVGSGELAPRQHVHAVPWALYAQNAYHAVEADRANTVMSTDMSKLTMSGPIWMQDHPLAFRSDPAPATNVDHAIQYSSTVSGTGFLALRGGDGFTWATGLNGADEKMRLTPGSLNLAKGTAVKVEDAKPFIFQRYWRVDNDSHNPNFDTHYSADTYTCGIVGMGAATDINENGTHLWRLKTRIQTGTWWVEIDWGDDVSTGAIFDVDLLCVRNEFASRIGY
jgi:hypothetical protein